MAFLVPILEKLYREQFTEYDGLGALIISPTRELAVQIFEVLRKIGRHHTFSAGLVIGGKSLKEEAERLGRMNILVCTPGRILQHFDQTAGLNVDDLRILVLDEADRIMDMGFQSTMDAVVEHLPKSRQTMLFSATQSKKVSDLARLSLKDPEYVSVHEAAEAATPSTLSQHYLITPLHEKLTTLYGFIKSNLKSKMIVFLSSGKQVRFAYESLRHLQPGIPLLHLHGRQKQVARLEITSRFISAKHACLFATDVVARGVDFPAVDWICQVDCPEDVDTYIHRVGRTARYDKEGKAVLFLDPSEEVMLQRLEHRKVPIQKVNIREKKKKTIQDQIQDMCFKDPNLKYLAQKAFTSYVRSVHLQRDKGIFDLKKLDLDEYAASLGLPGTPQIRFQKGEDVKKLKNASRATLESDDDDDESEFDEHGNRKKRTAKKKGEVRTKYDRMFERVNQDVLTSHYANMVGKEDGGEGGNKDDDDDDDDDDFLSVKRVIRVDNDNDNGNDDSVNFGSAEFNTPQLAPGTKIITGLGGDQPLVIDSKRREKLLKSKKALLKFKGRGEKIVFDDDGNAHHPYRIKDEAEFRREGDAEALRKAFVEGEMERVREVDTDDKRAAKERVREKRERRKLREREEVDGGGVGGSIGGGDVDGGKDKDKEDALAFLASLPVAGGGDRSDDGGAEEEEEEERRPRKKAKKWFEAGIDSSDDEDDDDESKGKKKKNKKVDKSGRKVIEVAGEPDTLEDLEALATGLLDD